MEQGEVAVECTHCKVRMRAYLGSGGQVRYFRCDKCRRWLSSTYQDVLRADAHFRAHKPDEVPEDPARFAGVKARLERWLAAIEDQDPYRVLGVSPLDGPETIRKKYRALALEQHPDRGGSGERMRSLNLAYERILTHREQVRRDREEKKQILPEETLAPLPR